MKLKHTVVKEIEGKLFIVCNDKPKPVKAYGFLQSDESYAAELQAWEEWETQYEVHPSQITKFQIIAMQALETSGKGDYDFSAQLKEGVQIPGNRVKILDGHKDASGEIIPMAFVVPEGPLQRPESPYWYQSDWNLMTKKDLRLLWEQIQQLNMESGLSQATLDECAKAIQQSIDKREE